MPTFCSVQGCSTWSNTDNKYTIFPFPHGKESAKRWRKALNLIVVRRDKGVCELHFNEAFLIREKGGERVTLKSGAIPKNSHEPIKPLISTMHCRMCGLSIKYCMTNTIAELQMDHRLRPVLEMCLELNNSKHSFLPVTVCDRCTKMVRFVGEFAETCWDAQQQLLCKYACGTSLKQHMEGAGKTLLHTSSDLLPPDQEVWVTAQEQDSEIESQGATQELSMEFDPDCDTSSLISIKEETLYNCNSTNDDSEKTFVGHADNSDHTVSEYAVFTVRELDSHEESKEASQELAIEFDHDSDVSLKAESLDYCNDENLQETSNHNPPRKTSKHRGHQIDMTSGRFKKYECVTCWQRLTSQVKLNMHMRKHEHERNEGKSSTDAVLTGWVMDTIKCLQCRKTFKTVEELKTHTAQEHKFEVCCPVCGIRFRDKEVLEQHRKRVRRCKHDVGRIK